MEDHHLCTLFLDDHPMNNPTKFGSNHWQFGTVVSEKKIKIIQCKSLLMTMMTYANDSDGNTSCDPSKLKSAYFSNTHGGMHVKISEIWVPFSP